MQRRTAGLLIGLLALVLVAWSVHIGALQVAPGPTYTLTQVQQGLAQNPTAWAGRTVRVRGPVILTPCNASLGCHRQQQGLFMEGPPVTNWQGAASAGHPRGLVVVREPAVPLMALLVHLPLVGRILIAMLHQSGTYRLRLESAQTCQFSAASTCRDAVLLEP